MQIAVFGNPVIEMDSLALHTGEELRRKGYAVEHCEDPLALLDMDLKDCILLDVAEGVNRVVLLTDVDKLVLGRLVSLHDFDLAYFLKLLKELGKLESIRIIALPRDGTVEKVLPDVLRLLEGLSPRNI